MKLFLTWASLVNDLEHPIVVHGNAPTFGLIMLQRVLGHKYIALRTEIAPTSLGWATRRTRQICVLVLKAWLFPLVEVWRIQLMKGLNGCPRAVLLGPNRISPHNRLDSHSHPPRCPFS